MKWREVYWSDQNIIRYAINQWCFYPKKKVCARAGKKKETERKLTGKFTREKFARFKMAAG